MHTNEHFDPDELLVFFVRKHWFILAVEVIGILVIALIPIMFYEIAYSFFGSFLSTSEVPVGAVFSALYSIWLIVLWMTLFNIWTNYYLDTWMLTTKRFIATDHVGLFHRSVATFRLERMQDVTVITKGILPMLLKFGSLQIQTAGEEGNFVVRGLPNPEQLKTAILDATGKASKELYGGGSDI